MKHTWGSRHRHPHLKPLSSFVFIRVLHFSPSPVPFWLKWPLKGSCGDVATWGAMPWVVMVVVMLCCCRSILYTVIISKWINICNIYKNIPGVSSPAVHCCPAVSSSSPSATCIVFSLPSLPVCHPTGGSGDGMHCWQQSFVVIIRDKYLKTNKKIS